MSATDATMGAIRRRSLESLISAAIASTTIAASGRYIRRSAPTSEAIGTKLDVGASVTKTHVARNAAGRLKNHKVIVAIRRPTMNKPEGRTFPRLTVFGNP